MWVSSSLMTAQRRAWADLALLMSPLCGRWAGLGELFRIPDRVPLFDEPMRFGVGVAGWREDGYRVLSRGPTPAHLLRGDIGLAEALRAPRTEMREIVPDTEHPPMGDRGISRRWCSWTPELWRRSRDRVWAMASANISVCMAIESLENVEVIAAVAGVE